MVRYIGITLAANRAGVSREALHNWCAQGEIKGAIKEPIKNGYRWRIPETTRIAKRPRGGDRYKTQFAEGFCGIDGVAEALHYGRYVAFRLVQRGRIQGAKKIKNVWHVPIASIDRYKEELGQ